MELTFIDMFCGIGGFRLGLERSGWRCVWANDIDRYACQVYRKNFGGRELVEGDIRAVEADNIPDHTLLTAGFPCQSFSLAGKRKGFEDARGTLFYDIARVARAKRPTLLLLENVRGLLSNDGGRTFARILQTLDELGYDVEWQVLNSKHFGVPQNRERVFIVGHLRGAGCGQIFPIAEMSEVARGEAEESEEQVVNCIDANYGRGTDKHGARTVVAESGLFHSNQSVMLEGLRLRRLTPVECERLQGFPDGWTEGISDTQRYRLLGNAVTVNVVEYLGARLLGCVQ
jgi:DNA (cytosine-5)-methyltransferase 1